ncbi:MAG: septal ring lytic transglycosylase RlpA family protein [Chlorobium sp.]|nr:septal ring lytic transglycosylase RlpA family protein [Chlorobiaceae bacterium]MCF8215598.1 septal ring lytic transglycosylase RlpA family protein [Chlorobium sp.]MCF8270348.1 septal ring lytic transglycosylase RlpA family protein [Chlorobium sp.]MCF8286717.1 septal ring lytic transglycosylase RlpA family protein [Chlorobium sp.]MCF8290239.1 septal ring lytic transglycosylase RlpA family protein [Chlorobium sp.]
MMTPRLFFTLLMASMLGLSSCSTSRRPILPDSTKALLSPEEAYRLGKLKNKPYFIEGKLYIPMDYRESLGYQETGHASWYGQETLDQHNNQPTAYGEIFRPDRPSAAHKYLPLPAVVKVTNLENNASIIVRVNDRGPFVGNRVIDLSAEAAKQLGFYNKGTARVKLEVVSK